MLGLFKLITLPNLPRPVVAREITLADARILAQTGGELTAQEMLLLVSDLSPACAAQISEEEIDRVLAAAIEVNQEFFGAAATAVEAAPDGKKVAADLALACARMVEVGHANVWDYPWGVFKAAVAAASAGAKG
jgi:prophage DNA circulation protein